MWNAERSRVNQPGFSIGLTCALKRNPFHPRNKQIPRFARNDETSTRNDVPEHAVNL